MESMKDKCVRLWGIEGTADFENRLWELDELTMLVWGGNKKAVWEKQKAIKGIFQIDIPLSIYGVDLARLEARLNYALEQKLWKS